MSKLYMMRGIPACGKTTKALEMIAHATRPLKRVNNDDLRAMIDGGRFSKQNEQVVRAVREGMIQGWLKNGYDVIVDNLNLAPHHEENYRQIAATYGAQFEIIDLTGVPLHECVARDRKRPNPVGEKVIWRWWEDYIKPTIRQTWEGPTEKQNTIISDIDGTLADFDGKRGHFEYSKVYGDKVIEPVAGMIKGYIFSDWPVFIHVLSGRDECCREETERWLIEKAGFPLPGPETWRLLMRATGDKRSDVDVKREIYERDILPSYRVLFAVEDRPAIVRLWRELNIFTMDVGRGVEF